MTRLRRPAVATLGAFLTVVAFSSVRNHAQTNEASVQFHVFRDTRDVTILSPAIDATKTINDRTTINGNFDLDAITAASDSCARCHRSGVTNRRLAGGFGVTRKFEDLKFTVGGAYSQERFYQATTLQTSVSRDLAKGNLTLAGGYAFSLNRPTLHPLPTTETQFAHNAFVSATRVLSKFTIAQAGYEIGQVNGYQDNPFLRTSVNGTMVLGHVPDARTRHTLSARLRQALPWDTFVDADYRHYIDTWHLSSDAYSAGVSHQVTPQLLARAGYRRYDQTGASFFAPQYAGATPTFYTGDFRLSPFTSGAYTGTVTLTPAHGVPYLGKGTALVFQYDRYRANNGFEAAIFTTGIRMPLSR